MNDNVLNWRTTIAGLLAATVNIIIAYLQGQLDTKTFIVSFFMAILGYFAKDAKKTGTKSNPR